MAATAHAPTVPTGPQFDDRRLAAAAIDLLIPAALAGLATLAGVSLTLPVIAAIVGWSLFYFFALESGGGQTLGKRLLGLRVTRPDGTPADLEQIAKRTVIRILDGHVVGLIVMIVTGDRRQRLGDIVAGTVITTADAEPEDLEPEDLLPAPEPARPAVARREPVAQPEADLRHTPPEPVPVSATPGAGIEEPGFAAEPVFEPEVVAQTEPEVLGGSEPIGPPGFAVEPIETEPPPVAEPRIDLDTDHTIEFTTHREHEVTPPSVEPVEPRIEIDTSAEHRIEFDRPAPRIELDDAAAARVEDAERDPGATAPHASDQAHRGEQAEPGLEHEGEGPVVKPIETVSAIDLIMQDAERRHGSE